MDEPKITVARRALVALRALRVRRGAAQLLELAGFAAIVAGVDRITGSGVALVIAGVLAVLVAAFEVDR